jgi:hypothetical protein
MGSTLAALLSVAAAVALLVLVWHLNAPEPAGIPRHAAEGEAESTGALPRHQRAEDAVEPWHHLDDQTRREDTHAIGSVTLRRALARVGGTS